MFLFQTSPESRHTSQTNSSLTLVWSCLPTELELPLVFWSPPERWAAWDDEASCPLPNKTTQAVAMVARTALPWHHPWTQEVGLQGEALPRHRYPPHPVPMQLRRNLLQDLASFPCEWVWRWCSQVTLFELVCWEFMIDNPSFCVRLWQLPCHVCVDLYSQSKQSDVWYYRQNAGRASKRTYEYNNTSSNMLVAFLEG